MDSSYQNMSDKILSELEDRAFEIYLRLAGDDLANLDEEKTAELSEKSFEEAWQWYRYRFTRQKQFYSKIQLGWYKDSDDESTILTIKKHGNDIKLNADDIGEDFWVKVANGQLEGKAVFGTFTEFDDGKYRFIDTDNPDIPAFFITSILISTP